MFKLVIEDDEGNKTVVPVVRDEITIGRKEGNTIRLTERNVSRRHAKLVRDNGAVYLEEVSARYGTRKNGDRIDGRTEFTPGDVFLIGDYRLTLQTEAAPEAKQPKKPEDTSPPPEKNEFSDVPTQITNREDVEKRGQEGTEILPAMPAKLVIVSSNFAGQEFPLNRKEMVIGRGEDCDIIIDHRSVSTKHAKVVREQNGKYKIVDLNSKNGVKISGEEYRAVQLKRGDVVELGHVRFRFVEPGENYVFTPSQAEDEWQPASGSSKNGAIIAIAGAGLVILVAAAYFLFGGGDDPDAVATTPGDTETGNTVASPTPPDEPPEESGDAEVVARKIETARAAYDEGDPAKAIYALESVEDEELSPTAEQQDAIDRLLGKAKREKQYAISFQDGRRKFESENYLAALKSFREVPPDSDNRIREIMDEHGYVDKSIDAVLAEAERAADEGEREKAKKLLEELAGYAKDDENYLALKEKVGGAGDKAVATKTNDSGTSTIKRPQKPDKPKRDPKPPKDPEAGKVAFQEANQKLLKGDWSGAISRCREGLRHGHRGCHRVIGIAYAKQGNKAKACSHFAKAGIDSYADITCE